MRWCIRKPGCEITATGMCVILHDKTLKDACYRNIHCVISVRLCGQVNLSLGLLCLGEDVHLSV